MQDFLVLNSHDNWCLLKSKITFIVYTKWALHLYIYIVYSCRNPCDQILNVRDSVTCPLYYYCSCMPCCYCHDCWCNFDSIVTLVTFPMMVIKKLFSGYMLFSGRLNPLICTVCIPMLSVSFILMEVKKVIFLLSL